MKELMSLAQALLGAEGLTRKVPAHILAVDDDQGNLDVLVGLLEDDYSIQATTSPEQALRLLETYEFDIVLADQRMPGMSGVELLTIAHQRCPETIRIIISAYSDSKELLDSINQGRVFRYVLKPWVPEELEGIIQQALERRHNRIAIRRLVDALKSRNDQLTKAVGELKEAQDHLLHSARLAAIGQLACSIAHEVRNQLTVVRAAYDFISDEQISDDLREMMRLGDLAFQNLVDMLRTVNSFARHRPWEIDIATVDLRRIVQDSLLMGKMDTRSKYRTIEFHEPQQPACANVDAIRVGQVVLNLLRNSLDATSPGGHIEVVLRRVENNWVISVRDDGSGIPEENMAKLFDPFFSTKENGVGLGLAICKQIAEAHGGSIEVVSRPNAGSTFSVSIPAAVLS